jgi:hypothetical protein
MVAVAFPFTLADSYLILLCNLTFRMCKLLPDISQNIFLKLTNFCIVQMKQFSIPVLNDLWRRWFLGEVSRGGKNQGASCGGG